MSRTKQRNSHIFTLITLAFMLVFPTTAKAQSPTPVTSLSSIGTSGDYIIENDITTGDASGNTGTVACVANGSARIYNVGILGGSVGGTAYTGGLVGFLDGTARVVNCYSYADITSGTTISPVYGGTPISNAGTSATTGKPRNQGGKLGTLAVHIQQGDGAVYGAPDGATITTSDTTLVITDKDPDHFNFNYYKVQLPYYNNVGTKNYNGNRVVTGWKIVNITGGTGSYNFGILIPKGWYESTNTSLLRFTQFEYEHKDRSTTDAIIVQGGVMEQWVSYNQKGRSNNIPYIHVGGNVWFKEFHTGCHQDKNQTSGGNRFQPTKHSPKSVTGGDFDEFYLTGLYVANTGLDNYADNAECYINGGRFGTVCGAAMEGIGKANGADNTGDITWLIQNADIHEFYAGGLNAAKPVTGNLATNIVDSHVDLFCGGPKFGDMSANKTVVTNATDCTFGTFFGAGYNGTYGGVSTRFLYQFLPMSSNTTNVARILIDFVKFSLATTHNVTSNLKHCTITGNFYGGGSLGKVDGPVTSTIDSCMVNGNVYGAGFSASLPTVEVTSTDNAIDKVKQILYTTVNLDKTNLGSVNTATITLKGNTTVGTQGDDDTGNVYGGGDESAVSGNSEVIIQTQSK